jgi:hypothetical protein
MWWKGNNDDTGEFINWNQIEGENGFGSHKNETDRDKYELIIGVDDDACGYGLDPICTSILNEDFNIAISNTWSEFGGDPIGQMWNDIRGPMAAVADPIITSINNWLNSNEELKNQKDSGVVEYNKFTGKIIDALSYVHGKVEATGINKNNIVDFLNKALITNGTRFSYYGGTGIAFGNLGMKFTVFPKWENNQFVDVQSQVTKMYPYFIGQMEDFKDAMPDVNSEFLNRCFKFQKPPGGYRANMNSIDLIQKGTLKLKIGSFYEITNLVCSDVMLNFSKNMVKNPTNQEISPLFCDVNITLRPSTKYSDKMLRAFVGGSDAARKSMKEIIKKNLDDERQN